MSYGYNIEEGTPMFSYYYGFNTYTNDSMVGWGGLSDAEDFLDPSGNFRHINNPQSFLLFRSVQHEYDSEEVIRCGKRDNLAGCFRT